MNDDLKKYLLAFCLLLGASAVVGSFLIPPESPDYPKRWLTFLVGCMVIVVGVVQIEALRRIPVSPELATVLQLLARIVVFGTFAAIFLAGGLMFGEEITGGIPFLSEETNKRLGRILFTSVGGIIGVIVVGLVGRLPISIVKWIRGRR